MSVKITIHGLENLQNGMLEAVGLQPHGRTRIAVDTAVIELSRPYVPTVSGRLADSPYTDSNSDIGNGRIVYSGPYAHYLYVGKVYKPNIPVAFDAAGTPIAWRSPRGVPKTPSEQDLQYQNGGPGWVEEMKAHRMDDILRVARGAINDHD